MNVHVLPILSYRIVFGETTWSKETSPISWSKSTQMYKLGGAFDAGLVSILLLRCMKAESLQVCDHCFDHIKNIPESSYELLTIF